MNKIELLHQMLKENDQNASVWFLLALEYKEREQLNEALKALAEALKNCDNELKEKIVIELTNISVQINNKENPYDRDLNQKDEVEDEHNVKEDSESNKIKLRVIQGGLGEESTLIEQVQKSRISFEDVGGLNILKETIRMKIIKPFANPGLFAKFRKKTGGGVILFGPPGCGKTFIAKATAGECKAKFIPVHITDILDPYIGVSEQNIKDIFSTARADKPAILFFDEIDAIGYHRSKSSSSHLRPLVDQLLSEMEGIDSGTEHLLIIGATNMPWDVDPAFLRPGRFDKVIFVPPPDELARVEIFRLKLENRPIEEVNLQVLARETELYSGADIENLIELATEYVISEIMSTGVERSIRMKDLLNAIKNSKPSTIDWLRTIKNYVKYSNQGGLYDDVAKYLDRIKI